MSDKVYVADFETRCSDIDIAKKETSVWLWDICSVDTLEHTTGNDIDSFFKHIGSLGKIVIYFHNLSNFDGFFIQDYLLRNKYIFKPNNKLRSKQFTGLIDERNEVYNLVVCINDGRRSHKKVSQVEFRDSRHKINSTVKKIAQDYKLPILKGEIDYKKYRPLDYEPTAEEISYIHNDTEIIARVLRLQYEKGMDKITSAGDTFNLYKVKCGVYFRSLFPELDNDTDRFIRNSYRGGVCLVNSKYRNTIVRGNINVYDVNSMYPNQMCKELLPYGHPVYEVGRIKPTEIRPLFIQHLRVMCRLKEGHFPSILLKELVGIGKEYLYDTDGEMLELWLTNIDLDLLYENYDIEYDSDGKECIEYIDGYTFLGSKNLFKDYILPLYDIKSKLGKGAERELIKILINALYGKFAMKAYHIRKEPYLVNDIVTYGTYAGEEGKPVYTAVASFITAYARKQLFSVINEHLNSFLYCDTDSCHLLDDTLPDELVDSKKLGYWDLEKVYTTAKYIKQKGYLGILKEGEKQVKLAGCPDSIKDSITLDNFNIGMSFAGKLLPMKVKGGVILMDTYFTIKDKK